MEAIWLNLQEQKLKLQTQQQRFNSYDLTNMESINHEEPPLLPPRKYVSIFRIDGEPILPPLMTIEKRKQMQKLKDKALQIEKRIRDRKHYAHYALDVNNEDVGSETSRTSHCNTFENISQRSNDSYENKLKESEESMLLLKNIIKRQEGGALEYPTETLNTASNTIKSYNSIESLEKIQKLKKSEILIYDNSTNEVIQVPAEKNKSAVLEECSRSLPPKEKPSQLLLTGVGSKGLTSIPSICLNPPTPITVNKHISDSFGKAGSSESLVISENPEKISNFAEDHSSDESLNSMRTHSDIRSSRNIRQNYAETSEKNTDFVSANDITITPIKNVSAKIQQFESIGSDSATPQSSPEKLYKARKICLGALTSGTMNRSATSPSIKLSVSNRSSSSRSQSLAQDSDYSPENSLVRSSSFTLEAPSKALIDHMRQQKTTSESKSAIKSPTNNAGTSIRRPISSSIRAHRDTVESKAKKVQKVELKSSKQRILQKSSQSKLAQAAVVSISPYNTTALIPNTNNLYKTKKSPYDLLKTNHNTIPTIQKTPNAHMRKSKSASLNLSQSKSSKPKVSSSTVKTPTAISTNFSKSTLPNDMDKIQKEKFQRLLAQQEEERRRLQQSFEMEQKLLIEELNREMVAVQLKSPNNCLHNSTSHYKESDIRFSLHLKDNLNAKEVTRSDKQNMPPIDSKQHKPHQQQSSPTISKSKNSSEIANSHHHSSYAIHYSQSFTTIPVNNSHLSSMDYSNANTSLDISTLSAQTSPDTLCSTPIAKRNSGSNGSVNKTVSTTSSSRRKLFTTDINAIESSRSTASSSYSAGQRTIEQIPQLIQSNKNFSSVIANDNSRRQEENNSLIVHAAATKINAYARGFLVRRLFQTEQIQRIVQTIRDTLIFVLSLHLETMENPEESHTPANIKLKARLLQQLSSACRTLHLVFFQTSIKERMEIIARDRKRIQTKLLSMDRRRTPRIIG